MNSLLLEYQIKRAYKQLHLIPEECSIVYKNHSVFKDNVFSIGRGAAIITKVAMTLKSSSTPNPVQWRNNYIKIDQNGYLPVIDSFDLVTVDSAANWYHLEHTCGHLVTGTLETTWNLNSIFTLYDLHVEMVMIVNNGSIHDRHNYK